VPGTWEQRFFRVYADPENGKEAFASPNDLAFQVDVTTGATSASRGTGVANGWTPASIAGWEAKAAFSANFESAEFRIPLHLINDACGKPSGLAVYHHWVSHVGDDYGWPSDKYYDQPQTWEEVTYADMPCGAGKIAYVFHSDVVTATEFKGLLQANGFTVTLIPLPSVLGVDFAAFDLVIVAHHTGYLDEWPPGSTGPSPEAVHIAAAEKPVVGLGEGGYAYFGKDGKPLGWPTGWHGPLVRVAPVNTGATYWHTPNDFAVPPSPLPLYGAPVAEVGIYLPSAPGTLSFGLEPADKAHAPLITEDADCNQLWGFAGPPDQMTEAGKKLFVNAATFGIVSAGECIRPPVPPEQCLHVTKTANPPDGTAVHVGDGIGYTLEYKVDNSTACNLQRGALEDQLPEDTLFVPGSASDGITPGADGVLRWNLGPLAPGSIGSKTFKVGVIDSACRNQRTIVDQARLATSLGVVTSNVVKHPVECPPVVPEGTQPPDAEDETQIYPYSLVAGHPTELRVRIRNLLDSTQTVTVTFETSPERFGSGIPYGALPLPGNPGEVVLPPLGSVEVVLNWTPVTSGHYCIRVRIESPGYAPVFTYRNLDVAENLQAGVQDDLPFAVGNPTAATADIVLVVNNTCPGWSAWVTPTVLPGVTPGEVRTATLSVVPPEGRPLGTECHIDVQGWIGGRLNGGIRKLDVPPLHLPEANPP
jgi:hypothetical protein